jgi:hypothetical protein
MDPKGDRSMKPISKIQNRVNLGSVKKFLTILKKPLVSLEIEL